MIIGICGPKYSGKSTLAHYLVTNYKFTNLLFAKPIKMMLTTLVVYQGATPEHARRMSYGDLKNKPSEYLDGRTPVQAMQTLGTEWGREIISELLWVNALKRHISSTTTYNKSNIVIDDLRFIRSEDDFIHANNGKIIRLFRKGSAPSEHRSEREYLQIKVDIDIENNGTIEETFSKIPAEWIYGKI